MSESEKSPVSEKSLLSQPESGEIAEETSSAAASVETPAVVNVAALQAKAESTKLNTGAIFLPNYTRLITSKVTMP